MNVRLLAILAIAGSLTACASQPGQVKPISGDTFEVSYYAGFKPLSWVEIKNRTLQSADSYCSERKQKMIEPVITSNKATGVMPKEATTRFRCVPTTQDVTSSN